MITKDYHAEPYYSNLVNILNMASKRLECYLLDCNPSLIISGYINYDIHQFSYLIEVLKSEIKDGYPDALLSVCIDIGSELFHCTSDVSGSYHNENGSWLIEGPEKLLYLDDPNSKQNLLIWTDEVVAFF